MISWIADAWDSIVRFFSGSAPESIIIACDEALTEEQAQALFDEIASHTEIPFDYPVDCCYARAQRMASLIRDKGIETKKAWAYGSLTPMKPDGTMVRFPPTPSGIPVEWGYHVAPTVRVRTADGACRDMVIDPSLRDRALTIAEWESTMGAVESSALTTSDTYLYRPDLGSPKLRQVDLAPGSRTESAFANHIIARDSALGR